MKKLQLLGIICLFIVLFNPVVFAEEDCVNKATIFLELETITREKNNSLSDWQYPKFRKHDYVYIKNMRLVNTGNCTFIEPRIQITFNSPSGEKGKIYFNDYAKNFTLQNITVGGEYSVKRVQDPMYFYYYIDNFQQFYPSRGFELDEIEEWIIDVYLDLTSRKVVYPYPTVQRGFRPYIYLHDARGVDYFNIYTLPYLKTEERSELAIKIAKWMFLIALLSFFGLLASIITNYYLLQEQKKQGRKLESLFNRLFGYQKDISRKIEKLHLIWDAIIKKKK